MKFQLDLNDNNTYQIQSFDLDTVTINDKIYLHNIIIMPICLDEWIVENFESLEVIHFEQLRALNPEVVLLGTGQKIRFPFPELLIPLINAGIGVEVMDTAAAIRTYMVLAAEGRKVAAALLFK
jgi:uncharacterized protein